MSRNAEKCPSGAEAPRADQCGGEGCFDIRDGVLVAWRGRHADVRIPEGVRVVGPGCFEGQPVETVQCPSTLREIGCRAFADCTALRSVCFNCGLERLGEAAFAQCASLTEADLPPGMELFGSGAFSGCRALDAIKIGGVPATLADVERWFTRSLEAELTACDGVWTFFNDVFLFAPAYDRCLSQHLDEQLNRIQRRKKVYRRAKKRRQMRPVIRAGAVILAAYALNVRYIVRSTPRLVQTPQLICVFSGLISLLMLVLLALVVSHCEKHESASTRPLRVVELLLAVGCVVLQLFITPGVPVAGLLIFQLFSVPYRLMAILDRQR